MFGVVPERSNEEIAAEVPDEEIAAEVPPSECKAGFRGG